MTKTTTKLICNQMVNGVQCGGVINKLARSKGKDPCECSKCGRKYPSYEGLCYAAKPDSGIPKPIKPAASKTTKKNTAKNKAVKRPVRDKNIETSFLPKNGGIEPLELETIYEEAPSPYPADDLKSFWSDTPDVHGITLIEAQKLLSAEAERLLSENFILGGINFNPSRLPEADALAAVRSSSIQSLTFTGKTSTQISIEDARKGEKARAVAEKKQAGLVHSEKAKHCLPYQFASGLLTEEQTKEFLSVDLIPKNMLKAEPPSPERLYKAVTAEKLAVNLSGKLTNEFTKDTVDDYVDFWKSICSEICNGEFGKNSYWIAAGSSWAIGEYSAEVIKTAFANGLTVTPMVSLEQLRVIFESSHNYLNDLEFLHNSPRSMRDSLEQFSMFNQAYRMIHEGAVSSYKPKPLPPYKFTWRAYTESDLMILTLPSVGLVTGGIAVLIELLNARAVAGLTTIIISLCSVKKLNDLNAGFIPEFFGTTGASLVSRKEIISHENMKVNNFAYFTVYGDASERSSIQRKTQRLEKRQESEPKWLK